MSTITQQLTQLNSDREDLIDNLTTMGIAGLTGDETFTELVPQVLNIPAGSSQDFEKLLNRTITSIDNDNITTVGKYAVSYCTSLTSVKLSNATTIGTNAFEGCTNLTTVNMPSLSTISSKAFSDCSSLSSITFNSSENPVTIGSYAFNNCTSLVYIPKIASLATSISQYAFYGCSALKGIKGVSIFPDRLQLTNLTSGMIGNYAFYGCSSLTKLYVGNSQAGISGTSIGEHSFENCTSLTLADLSACSNIYSYAFKGCTNLATMYLRKSLSVCTLASTSAFDNVTGPVTIYVPSTMVNTYKSANNWSTLYNNGKVTFTAIS